MQAQKTSTILGQDSYRTSSRPGRIPSRYRTPPPEKTSINSNPTNSFKTQSWMKAMHTLLPDEKAQLKQDFRDYPESKPTRWIV